MYGLTFPQDRTRKKERKRGKLQRIKEWKLIERRLKTEQKKVTRKKKENIKD